MRWPFGPPHLTLKPSKKNKKQKKKTNKKKQKKEKKRSPPKKTAKTPKNSFSIISQFFPVFWVAFQNFPFLTSWPRKPEPKKHYKNRGFRAFFLKSSCVSRNGRFWTKNPKFIKENFQKKKLKTLKIEKPQFLHPFF